MAKFLKKESKKDLLKAKVAKVCKNFEDEAEEILEDAEEVVKENMPGKHVKASLNTIASRLADTGINARFDLKISRDQLKKTANLDVTEEDVTEALEAIVDATVDSFNDLLEKTEVDVDAIVEETVEDSDEDLYKVDDEVKSDVESCLEGLGVCCKFDRKRKVAARKTAVKRVNPILARIK